MALKKYFYSFISICAFLRCSMLENVSITRRSPSLGYPWMHVTWSSKNPQCECSQGLFCLRRALGHSYVDSFIPLLQWGVEGSEIWDKTRCVSVRRMNSHTHWMNNGAKLVCVNYDAPNVPLRKYLRIPQSWLSNKLPQLLLKCKP